GEEATLEVEDGRGNKVFKKALKASDYGLVHADFPLADEVNEGTFRLRAVIGEQRSEKEVRVKKYTLPKFKVELRTRNTFYLPGEPTEGSLQADYFFGKPVAGAAFELKASTVAADAKLFQTLKGTTDHTGHARFKLRLPVNVNEQALARGDASVRLEAAVTDTAEHSETAAR